MRALKGHRRSEGGIPAGTRVASSGRSSTAGAGLPLFVTRGTVRPRGRVAGPGEPAAEARAEAAAETVVRGDGRATVDPGDVAGVANATPPAPELAQTLSRRRGQGHAMPTGARTSMESGFGVDLGQVRLHTDPEAGQLARRMGAKAFTAGSDIYFDTGRYQPGSDSGKRLLAHEVAHVVQQAGEGGPGLVQCDLMESLPTALGAFGIEMQTRGAPQPGMEGHVRFFPDPQGPYSARIGLVQTVNFTDVAGSTGPAGSPVDWSGIRAAAGVGAEAGRNDLMTTGAGTAPEGWMVDANTAANAPGASVSPDYIEHWISPAPDNEYGWLRSPTDWHETSLYDYPWFSFDVDFQFETVARATDTQTIYGALEWGFGIRSGVVQNEYARAFDAESATFNEALDRYRGYYTHEPVVFYFDTADDLPEAGEADKLDDVVDYLNTYPDAMVRIEGYADERGREGDNMDLAERRANNVQELLLRRGIPLNRIDYAVGWGETSEFAAGHNAGTWRANRRAVMSFVRTASTSMAGP